MLADVLLWASLLLEAVTLLGLAWRRRFQRLLSLPVLLVAVAASTLLPLAWPASRNWSLWLWREFTHAALLLLMGLELALLLFLRLPEARRHARRWIALVIVGLLVILLSAPAGPLMTTLLPRLVFALVWLYGGLTWLALDHHVPVDPLHKTVLVGFTAYMLVYALSWGFTGADTRLANLSAPLAFDLMMVALAWAAWRDDRVPGVSPRTLEYLWPWRRAEPAGRDNVGSRDRTGRALVGDAGPRSLRPAA